MDWIDYTWIIIGLCAVTVYAVALTTNLYFLARIPGIFATVFFDDGKISLNKNATLPVDGNHGCHLGIELNEFSHVRLQK